VKDDSRTAWWNCLRKIGGYNSQALSSGAKICVQTRLFDEGIGDIPQMAFLASLLIYFEIFSQSLK
jgi:hypothetical protein